MNNVIVTLTGPSGSGKSTLEKHLKSKGLISLISTTTRRPRAGEVNGQHYYFVDKEQFKAQKEQGLFVEEVTFNDEYYGLYKTEVDKLKQMNSPAVIVVEPQGKAQVEKYAKAIGLNCLRVFIDVDSQTQMERLLQRFNADMSDVKTYDFRHKKLYGQIVAANAKRLVIVTTEERVWLADAYERDAGVLVNYDHIVKSFDADTQQSVINQLENAIDSILARPRQLAALVEKSGDKTEVTKLSPSTTKLKLTIEGFTDSLICINNCLGDNVLIGSVNNIRLIRDLG